MHARALIFEDCTYVNVESFLKEQPMKKFRTYNSWICSKWRMQSEFRYYDTTKVENQ